MASKRIRDAEELRRRKMARLHFRKIIRLVVLNRLWLAGDHGDAKLSLNVKKNIALLVRPQRKIGLLTMSEKSVLRMHHTMRTVEERKQLVILLAGLPCFSKIPPKVCARLAPVINFIYAAEGRLIVREGDDPSFVYFILSGEVVVSKRVYDHLTHEYIDRMECLSGPGDCFGDIEIIEECPRRNSYTAASLAELLVLTEPEFRRLLYPVMATQWLDKRNALLALGYFKFFTQEQMVNACKVGLIRQFDALETIYHEDKGPVSYVHFVISGECVIIQCLKMKVTQKKGKKSFELVDISKDDGGKMFDDMTNQDLLKKLRADEKEMSSAEGIQDFTIDEDEQEKQQKLDLRALREMEFKRVEISCGLRKDSNEELAVDETAEKPADAHAEGHEAGHEGEMHDVAAHDDGVTEENGTGADDDQTEIVTGMGAHEEDHKVTEPHQDHPEAAAATTEVAGEATAAAAGEETAAPAAAAEETAAQGVPETRKTLTTHDEHKESEKETKEPEKETKELEKDNKAVEGIEYGTDPSAAAATPGDEEKPRPSALRHSEARRSSARVSIASEDDSQRPSTSTQQRPSITRKPSIHRVKVENRFIDVGSLTFGGIFGLGEKIEHRVIMARTTVQCLLLPRFWLLEKEQNPGNIWQRRRFYLDTTIPSRTTLFTDFLTTRKWQQFKNDLISSCVDQSLLSNPTKVQDVPIICRIVDAADD